MNIFYINAVANIVMLELYLWQDFIAFLKIRLHAASLSASPPSILDARLLRMDDRKSCLANGFNIQNRQY
jgi:hypothetical protein